MITRSVRKIPLGDGMARYIVHILGDECPPDTFEARFQQRQFLKTLAENQVLLECGLNVFQKLKITHNGTQWVCEVEAEGTDTVPGI